MTYPISDDKLPLAPLTQFLPELAWNIGAPADSDPVRAFSVDRRGPYCIPFPVRFRDGAWRNGATGDVLRCDVKGWRV